MSLTLTGAGAGADAIGTPYATRVLATTGLIDYWRLGESVGPNAADAKGANTGTYVGSPTLGVAGAVTGDTAVTFDGSTQYVLVKSASIVATLASSTCEAWVKWTSGAKPIYCERGATGNAIWKFEVNASGNLFFTHRDDAGTLNQFDSTVALTAGTWTHVAAVKSTTALTMYKSGVQAGISFTLTGNDTLTATAIESRIGSDKADVAGFWNGSLDEVALYNVAVPVATLLDHAAG